MDEYEQEIKNEIDKIPQSLKDEFVPALKQEFANLSVLMQQIEDGRLSPVAPQAVQKRENYLKALEDLSKAFFMAGGDDRYWNALSVAVDTGIYDKIHQPK